MRSLISVYCRGQFPFTLCIVYMNNFIKIFIHKSKIKDLEYSNQIKKRKEKKNDLLVIFLVFFKWVIKVQILSMVDRRYKLSVYKYL